jgi:hypothetical protein
MEIFVILVYLDSTDQTAFYVLVLFSVLLVVMILLAEMELVLV